MRIALTAAFALLLVAGTAQAAQTVDISSDNRQANAAFQKEYGMSVSCPNRATIGVPFTCTYSNDAGASAPVQYVIRKPGGDRVAVSDAQENAALTKAIPLDYWIGVGEKAYDDQKGMRGATMTCAHGATSPSQTVKCTLTSKSGAKTANVTMRFKPVKPVGYALVPVTQKQFTNALLAVA